MIAPAWLQNETQPIGIDDTLEYLRQAPAVEASAGREIQIGGPDVLAYGQMLDRMAMVLGVRPRPRDPCSAHHAVVVLAVDRAGHAR